MLRKYSHNNNDLYDLTIIIDIRLYLVYIVQW